eukprot:TRINITY_DN6098_c1_g1_i1.p1 TRINITY_DN6098_c1_g1~~TRINITY_DN6098_c1_g1_i1.p1  ORF type:complete len:571 (+),score=142.20 TRINITY_DN6098_c1_g1_i1:39-1751(+)
MSGGTDLMPVEDVPACVEPKADCPHIAEVVAGARFIDTNQPCSECRDTKENWVCLTCFEVHCSRWQPGQHMLGHLRRNPTHCVAASFSDLSFWCYKCKSNDGTEGTYVKHPTLDLHYKLLCDSKFGGDAGKAAFDADAEINAIPREQFFAFHPPADQANLPLKDVKLAEKPEIFKLLAYRASGTGTELCNYTLYAGDNDAKKKLVDDVRAGAKQGLKTDRLMGNFLGMVAGDSLGAPMEFKPVRYTWNDKTDDVVKDLSHHEDIMARFKVKGGQWTDDAAMGLCIADSLLAKKGLDILDLKMRFVLWWEFGYNNAFGRDEARVRKTSVGLGGNISQSFDEFITHGWGITRRGDENTSGNGSLMRNAAIPVFFCDNMEAAMEAAYTQSITTHQGIEAAELCKVLTYIVIECAKHPSDDPKVVKEDVLGNLGKRFKTNVKSVGHLIRAEQETPTEGKDWDLKERNWQWKQEEFRFAPGRAEMQPDYIGSYAMDNLSMSLHIVWSTNSLTEALLKAANQCGDADTVASVVGQIAGSIYGLSALPTHWLDEILKWDNNGDILLRAHKLTHNRCL